MNRRIIRTSCPIAQVPPFCVLAADRSLDEAVHVAVRALGLSQPIDILVLAWKLRAVAEGACDE